MSDRKHPNRAVILAGGFGTRLTEETALRPKPMIEIGEQPILWHIMKMYGHYGINDFVICLGHKGHYIKEYFISYLWRRSSITVDVRKGEITSHVTEAEPWRVSLVDTGPDTPTGERLRQVRPYLDDDRPFFLTYGDGVADIDLPATVNCHMNSGKLATITAVSPPGRFGALRLDGTTVTDFDEKPPGDRNFINGGFMVMEPGVMEYLRADTPQMLEAGPLVRLAQDGQLAAYQHSGFWQPMDTLRDMHRLQTLWAGGNAPWKVWD